MTGLLGLAKILLGVVTILSMRILYNMIMSNLNLSVVLATFNEEKNIGACLESVKNLADEVIIVDGSSTDKTVEIAKKFGTKVIITDNPPMFHINKQKALDAATGDWILQLDADERVMPELAEEIKKIIKMSEKEIEEYQKNLRERELFMRHQRLTNPKFEISSSKQILNSNNQSYKRLGLINSDLFGTCDLGFSAFYIPRRNFFLGRYLRYGGVYPDGVIRLVKKGKARFPCKDVHELMEVDGLVGWLKNPLLHYDSPTFKRYLQRNNRYIDLMVDEMKKNKVKKTVTLLPCYLGQCLGWFFSTTIIHKGILDGWQGVVFSFFSALRFPRAYWRYIRK